MKTLHLDPRAGDNAAPVAKEVDRLLREGKAGVAEEQELLSTQSSKWSAPRLLAVSQISVSE